MTFRHETVLAQEISQFPPTLKRWNEGDPLLPLSGCSGATSPFVVRG